MLLPSRRTRTVMTLVAVRQHDLFGEFGYIPFIYFLSKVDIDIFHTQLSEIFGVFCLSINDLSCLLIQLLYGTCHISIFTSFAS